MIKRRFEDFQLKNKKYLPVFFFCFRFTLQSFYGALAFLNWNDEHTSNIPEIEALIMASEVIVLQSAVPD